MDKKASRLRRATRARAKIRELGVHRLTVHRTPKHVYAQVISADNASVVVAASTLEKSVVADINGHTGNISAAVIVGKVIAERAKAQGVERVAFDRSGYRYHGRVKALADSAREHGLAF
jgi:large subunit ribosomal protein L18